MQYSVHCSVNALWYCRRMDVLKRQLLNILPFSIYRKKEASMKRFFIREKEFQEEISSRVQEWSLRKDIREEVETMTELQTIQKRRAEAMQARAK